MMLMMGLLLMSGALMAQEVTPSVGDVTVNVNTFTVFPNISGLKCFRLL